MNTTVGKFGGPIVLADKQIYHLQLGLSALISIV